MKSVVHEIRNQLAVAIANVEAFRDGVLFPSPERLASVAQALADATALLADLPADSAAPPAELAPRMRSINVCEVITNAVLAFEGLTAERHIAFRVRQCSVQHHACEDFLGDPIRVSEIVNNVVSNAIRYTPDGGRIDVDCRRSGGALAITVTDDGPGVRGDEIARIFEAGFRGAASHDTSGSGVGLALTARFVEQHGGSIQVENVPGRGARFTVRMPGTALAPPEPSAGDGVISASLRP
jgi:two-component system sensor histidine kinase BaeS